MLISGEGITTTNLKIHKDFEIQTELALRFFDLYNGGKGFVDRGVEEDSYKSIITVHGTKDQILTFLRELELNRDKRPQENPNKISNVIELSGFNISEKIFGADIDYSRSIVVTPIISSRVQRTINTWSVDLELISQDITFLEPILPTFPKINFVSNDFMADFNNSINKQFSLNNFFWIRDHNSDSGGFSGTIQFSQKEMVRVRSFHRTNRGLTFDLPTIDGIEEVFGIRDKGSLRVKLIEISNETIVGFNCDEPVWECYLTLSEVFD